MEVSSDIWDEEVSSQISFSELDEAPSPDSGVSEQAVFVCAVTVY